MATPAGDPVAAAIRLAEEFGLTPELLRQAAHRWESGISTLREALVVVERAGIVITVHHPESFRYALEGRHSSLADRTVGGFGDRPFTDFTKDRVARAAADIEAAVAAERDANGTRSAAGTRRHDGAAAAEHYCLTARAIARGLRDAGVLAYDPLAGLKTPKRPGQTRDRALTPDELRDYLSIVIINSPDPYLDAIVWSIVRVTAARNAEVLALDEPSASPHRPSLVLAGKGGPVQELPAHRPLVEHALDLARARPRAGSLALLRTQRGVRISGRIFDRWSKDLHAHAPWAHGHAIGVHALRHSTAREVDEQCGGTSHASSLYLRHQDAHLGTVGHYLHLPSAGEWRLRCEVAERVFGPLDSWPDLPENDVLRALLPAGPWS